MLQPPFPAPSPVLGCQGSFWRAVVFSAGGDGVRKRPECDFQNQQLVFHGSYKS
jgi:hypothetical protein